MYVQVASPDSQLQLGLQLAYGFNKVPISYSLAIAALCRSIDGGCAAAAVYLAGYQYWSNPYRKQEDEAKRLCGVAVEMGLLTAMDTDSVCAKGIMYRFGWGIEKDLVKAVSLYQQAADQGHADAKRNLEKMS